MKISHSPYILQANAPLNSRSTAKSRWGALLRVQVDGITGYADCHPWTELGDLPLKDQLDLLSKGKLTYLTKRSLSFAYIDGKARSKKKSLFDDLTIPLSHFLVINLKKFSKEFLQSKIEEGFTRFKIKVGRDLLFESLQLKRLISCLPNKDIKFRLDFNSKLSYQKIYQFCEELAHLYESIDFIEDPSFFDAESWWRLSQKFNINFASDYQSHQAIRHVHTPSFLVMKPAIQNSLSLLKKSKNQKIVITSYLDHPLGQATAAYEAGVYLKQFPKKIDICGLLTHQVYQSNLFSDQIKTNGPRLILPGGYGFGFDDLLNRMTWKEI